jgi:REP element-mobilizing transposase RayT
MKNERKRKGHPPRLPGWDYSWAGAYFVTFGVQDRSCCLSTIVKGQIQLSPWGHIVEECWLGLPELFAGIMLDEMVVMPNHVHAIVFLTNPDGACHPDNPGRAFIHEGPKGALINQGPTDQGPTDQGPTDPGPTDPGPTDPGPTDPGPADQGPTLQPMMADPRMVLGKVIRAWKAKSTRMIRRAGHRGFAWQSRYYEHIIRNPDELHRIRRYVRENAVRWESDREHPTKIGAHPGDLC